MESPPRLTIGVPVYNAEQYIARALDSLLNQSFEAFEIIVSDNASTDNTQQICEAYARSDHRIRYMRNAKNIGAARNFNLLANLGTGELFKWAMADDQYKPDLIESCIRLLDENPDVVLASTRTEFVDKDGQHLRYVETGWHLMQEDPHERLRYVIYKGGHWVNADALAGVIRRAMLIRTRLIPNYQGGDKRLLGELSLAGKFFEIPQYWIVRTQHSSSSGHNNPAFAVNKEEAILWTMRFFSASTPDILRPTWTLYRDHARTVFGSGLRFRHKLALSWHMIRAMRWSWDRLIDELKTLWTHRKLVNNEQ